jgi:hypothetical protein
MAAPRTACSALSQATPSISCAQRATLAGLRLQTRQHSAAKQRHHARVGSGERIDRHCRCRRGSKCGQHVGLDHSQHLAGVWRHQQHGGHEGGAAACRIVGHQGDQLGCQGIANLRRLHEEETRRLRRIESG